MGLKSNGTVVAVGDNSDGQCDVYAWSLGTSSDGGGGGGCFISNLFE